MIKSKSYLDHLYYLLDMEYNVSQLDNVCPTSVGFDFMDGSQ